MNRRITTVTPPIFFDLFVLCLSWQWDESSLTAMFTTVDKVVRILAGLGILTKKQRKVLFKDRRTQSLFAMKCGRISSNFQEDEDGEKRNIVLKSRYLLVVSHDSTKDFSRERMLRDYRIYLSHRGKAHADSLQAKYGHVVTRESYRFECDRQEMELKSPQAKAAVMKEYRARVDEETKSA